MRPILRPGSHVLRRDARTLQVGLDPQDAVVLPDDPGVRHCLELLSRSAGIGEYDAPDTLDALTEGGQLLDSDSLIPLIPAAGQDRPPARADVAALARAVGDRAPDALRARATSRLAVVAFDDTLGGELADGLRGLLDGAGVRVTATGHHDATALVGVGEPRRELADRWMRAGTPHLVVRLAEGRATVGPFVVPGRTACLRCLDAHHTDVDPCWPLLVEQYASLTGRHRPDAVPEPVDMMLAAVALAWAARDLTSYVEGRRPSTWSTTIRLDAHLASIETRAWLRHPACGCAWG